MQWLRLNFFTPTKKPVGYTTTADGRRTRIYDQSATPWQRLQASGVLEAQHLSVVAARVDGINPRRLDPPDQHHPNAAGPGQTKTEALAAAPNIDLEALQPSINRWANTQ